MRIALLTDGIHPYVVGGMQRHSFYLAKYFASHGHHVDLYHTNQSDKDINALDVFTEDEKKYITSIVVKFPSLGTMPGHYIKESYEYSRAIYTQFKKQAKVDFVYAKGFSGWELLNQKSKGVEMPPVGLNFHGYEMFQPAASFTERLKFIFLLRGPVKFCVANADYLFSYGGKITDIIADLGVARDNIVVIPAGVTNDWIHTKPHVPTATRKFLFVGRFERRKGLPELYQAIRSLPKNVNAEFHFIGNIPLKHRVADQRCVFHGAITNAASLQEQYRAADILVCPSRSEGMPNVILEGMASGLAIVATNVGAVSEAVDSTNGWVIEPGSQSELNRIISEAAICSAEELAAKSANSVRKVQEQLNWDVIGPRTIEAIRVRLRSEQ